MTPPDDRSPLIKKLAEMMPPKTTPNPNTLQAMRIEYHPIRQSAEAFTRRLDGQMPANEQEMICLLWTFGELLCGQMEAMLNHSMSLRDDLLAAFPIKPQTHIGVDTGAGVDRVIYYRRNPDGTYSELKGNVDLGR